MTDALSALAALSLFLRSALLVGGIVVAGIAAVDWGVRSRHISPFNGVARFMRGRVDPRLGGIERQVLRAGGHPSATPWWALMAYVVLALILIAGADLVASLAHDLAAATSEGGVGLLLLLVHWTFAFLSVALIVRVLSSWLPAMAGSRWVSWSYPVTEWMLRPLRGLLPQRGPIDISPIVAYFALWVLQMVIESILRSGR